ncbi:hypothetical protein DFJ73DRAFT_894914 [Zopfochytrium polystomum]|nr:hypothetical protein DFJ73DRAFT_894914 [Zopfochytrium polystomum]
MALLLVILLLLLGTAPPIRATDQVALAAAAGVPVAVVGSDHHTPSFDPEAEQRSAAATEAAARSYQPAIDLRSGGNFPEDGGESAALASVDAVKLQRVFRRVGRQRSNSTPPKPTKPKATAPPALRRTQSAPALQKPRKNAKAIEKPPRLRNERNAILKAAPGEAKAQAKIDYETAYKAQEEKRKAEYGRRRAVADKLKKESDDLIAKGRANEKLRKQAERADKRAEGYHKHELTFSKKDVQAAARAANRAAAEASGGQGQVAVSGGANIRRFDKNRAIRDADMTVRGVTNEQFNSMHKKLREQSDKFILYDTKKEKGGFITKSGRVMPIDLKPPSPTRSPVQANDIETVKGVNYLKLGPQFGSKAAAALNPTRGKLDKDMKDLANLSGHITRPGAFPGKMLQGDQAQFNERAEMARTAAKHYAEKISEFDAKISELTEKGRDTDSIRRAKQLYEAKNSGNALASKAKAEAADTIEQSDAYKQVKN